MIKKQVLSCSVLFTLLFLAKVSDHDARARENKSERPITHRSVPLEKADIRPVENPSYLNSLHFANEFPPLEDKQIRKKMLSHLHSFSHKRQNSNRIHELAVNSLPAVESILAHYGIPSDFKYVPLVESRFTKDVTSPKGASGYWQFMPETARAFGLKVNDEVDERQDLVKSTHAAAKYLKALYREFDNWALVAAAYNVGSGNLRKAIKAQGEDNYFRLKLNRETSAYVYNLIAMKEIIEHPVIHGYTAPEALLAQAMHSSKSEGTEGGGDATSAYRGGRF